VTMPVNMQLSAYPLFPRAGMREKTQSILA
jgi:hypothetical protein